MLLTPQHRRSSRVAARMQKTAQQAFDEKIANGTMTKEALLNTPKCLRNFDEAEDAILAQDNTSWCGKFQNDESGDESEDDDDFDNEDLAHPLSHLEHSDALIEDPVLLRLIVSKLPHPLVAAIIQQLIQELGDVEREIDDANMAEEEEEEEEEEEVEDSIASRLLARRLKASRGW